MTTNCSICGELICKYELDWNSTGAIQVQIKDKLIDICFDCAKEITKEFVEEQ